MQRLIESVPNFSEGRDKAVIDAIAGAIEAVPGAALLHVDRGRDTNRTVMTLVGEPEPVIEAAFQAIARAAALIDLRRHKGAHPRIGATDVCPIVPVQGISIAECLPLAEALARRVGEELGIPVYLYAASARVPERVGLPEIRKGEYEGLEARMKDPAFQPDFGPARFNPKAGATVIGVRDFLLAYNVNLNTRDRRRAATIAAAIRKPSRLRACQTAGWYIDAYGLAQVTMNLLDFRETGLHTAFEAVREEAERLGLRVTGSELVGMVPRQAVLDAGVFYLRKMGKSAGIPEEEIIHTAILSLGLGQVTPFLPEEKILEYALDARRERLANRSLASFLRALSSDSPAPGGGSVSALSGALSAGLVAMVASLTHAKADDGQARRRMEAIAVEAQALKMRLLALVDADADAFNAYVAAMRAVKKGARARDSKAGALEAAAQQMTRVPLETLKSALALIGLAEKALRLGDANALSDAVVAVLQAGAAAEGAYFNVRINLPLLRDRAFAEAAAGEAEAIVQQVQKAERRLVRSARKRLGGA